MISAIGVALTVLQIAAVWMAYFWASRLCKVEPIGSRRARAVVWLIASSIITWLPNLSRSILWIADHGGVIPSRLFAELSVDSWTLTLPAVVIFSTYAVMGAWMGFWFELRRS